MLEGGAHWIMAATVATARHGDQCASLAPKTAAISPATLKCETHESGRLRHNDLTGS